MRILLVQAYLGGFEIPVFPLGLHCLSRHLKGHQTVLFDPNVVDNHEKVLVEKIRSFRPELVGISLRNIDSTNKKRVVFYYPFFKDMVGQVRRAAEDKCAIAVGGSGFTMFARRIMEDEPGIDYGVVMEGETSFSELADNIATPERVPGVFYRKEGRILFSGRRQSMGMSAMVSAYNRDTDLDSYRDIPEAIGIETKRGCSLGCIYCVYPFLNGRRYRYRYPEKVADEIEFIVSKKGVKHFTFIDSTFNLPLDHAEAVLREMVKRNLDVSWSAWFHDTYITDSLAELIVDAGCRKVILSPDGFSDSVLKKLGKTQSSQDIVNTFNLLRKYPQLEICYNFFKNPPGQTWENFSGLIQFMYSAKRRLGNRVHFELNALRIEPGTELCQLALKEGVISSDEDLLTPKYYTNKKTLFMNHFFNLILRLKVKQ